MEADRSIYEAWWTGLDDAGRRTPGRPHLFGLGVPDSLAETMTAAGVMLRVGVVGSRSGVRRVQLAPRSLQVFTDEQRT